MKSKVSILVIALIAVEQIIKLVINHNFLGATIPLLPPWVYFRPVFNRDYSWVNSMLQLGVGKWVHIVLVAVILYGAYLFYRYLAQTRQTSLTLDTAFAFILAGALCSLIDKIFWDGSLDYIMLRGLFTFDLKDVYINIFIALVVILAIKEPDFLSQVSFRDFLNYVFKR